MSNVDVRALKQAYDYQLSDTMTFGVNWMVALGRAVSGRLMLELLELMPSVESMGERRLLLATTVALLSIHRLFRNGKELFLARTQS